MEASGVKFLHSTSWLLGAGLGASARPVAWGCFTPGVFDAVRFRPHNFLQDSVDTSLPFGSLRLRFFLELPSDVQCRLAKTKEQ